MIVVSATPRIGDTVQLGEHGEFEGTLEELSPMMAVARNDSGRLRCSRETLFLLSEWLVDTPDYTGPIERAHEELTPGYYHPVTASREDGEHSGVLVVESKSAHWICSVSCPRVHPDPPHLDPAVEAKALRLVAGWKRRTDTAELAPIGYNRRMVEEAWTELVGYLTDNDLTGTRLDPRCKP
jgi:hypothetical protein